jgi:glutathione synthase/RimK-type ligase-like ATP-grasp enzyme
VVGERILFGEMELKDFDGWYFRAVGSELEWSKLLQLYGRKHKIRMVDDYLWSEGPLRRFKSVMSWQLLNAGILYPKSAYIERIEDLEQELSKWEFPVIVKLSSGGRHGMGTFFLKTINNFDDLKKRLLDRKETAIAEGKSAPDQRGFLVQEYIENDGDFRVMTVGYKCIGGFKRQVKVEKLVLNQSEGRSVGLEIVPEDVATLAEEAARVLGVEVAGTDLVRNVKDGRVYIIEVNEAPQFKVFEKRTKVNVARKILEHCAEKFRK